MANKLQVLIATALVFLLGVSATAHHSPAVFDRTKEVKLVGAVKEFRWSNPHSFIELDVRNEKGGTDTWAIEMDPPSYLVKAGWTAKTVKAGDMVTITVNPLRTPEPVGKFVSITLPGGKVLTERPASPAK
jgi:Family of unknown function (DUF6152)